MNKDPRFERAAQETISRELEALEKRIMSDLAGMIMEAHTALAEAQVFQKFGDYLKGRKPVNSDLPVFKRMIEEAVESNDQSFSQYFTVVVERDSVNRNLIGFEFKVKPEVFLGQR